MTDQDLEDQKDMLIKAMRELRKQIDENGDGSAAATKTLEKLNEKFKELEKLTKAKEIADGFNKLDKSVKSGRAGFDDLAKELGRLDQAQRESGVVMDKATAARQAELRSALKRDAALKVAGETIESAASAYIKNYISNFKDSINALSRGSNAFDLATNVYKNNIDFYKNSAKGFSDALGNTALAIGAAFGPAGIIAGSIVSGVSKLFSVGVEQAAELAKFRADVLNQETQKLVSAFASVSKVGAIFTNGVSGMADIAKNAEISIKQMSTVVTANKDALVTFGGTVGGGVAKLGKVFSYITTEQRNNMRNLGMSTEEQMSVTADYISLLAASGTLTKDRLKNEQQLAQESYAYALNLKTISAITGEDAKAAQKRARDASTQSFVQSKLQAKGGDALAKFEAAIQLLPAPLKKAAQQMEAFEGAIVDPELAATIAQMPAAQEMLNKIVSGVDDSSRNVGDFTQDLLNMKQQLGPVIQQQAMSAGQTIGMVNLATGAYAAGEEVIQSLQKFGQQVTQSAPGIIADAQATTKKAAVTTDELTTSLSKAQTQFNLLEMDLENKLRPAIKNFADFANTQMEDTKKYINRMLQLAGLGTPETNAAAAASQGTRVAETGGGAAMVSPNIGRRNRNQAVPNNNLGLNLPQVSPDVVDVQSPMSQENKRSDGGVAYGPTLTGEGGPEAHIPLKGGSIPLKIDFGQMIQALDRQSELTAELITHVRDSKDVQERILNASY